MYNNGSYCCNSCRQNPIFYSFSLKKKIQKKISSKKIKKSKLVNFRFQLDRKLGFRVRAKNCKIEKAGRTLPTGVLLPACVVCVYDLYNIYTNIYAYDLPRRSSSQEVLLLWLQKGNWAGVHLQLLLNPPSKTNIFITFPFPVHASTSPLLDLAWPALESMTWNIYSLLKQLFEKLPEVCTWWVIKGWVIRDESSNIFITFPHAISCGKVIKIFVSRMSHQWWVIPDDSSLMTHQAQTSGSF